MKTALETYRFSQNKIQDCDQCIENQLEAFEIRTTLPNATRNLRTQLHRIRLTNYTADHGAGLLGLLSIRPCGGGEFSDSVNWKVAQPWQD